MKCKEQIQVKTEHDGLQDTKSCRVSFVLRSIFIWSDDSDEHFFAKTWSYFFFFIVLAVQHSTFFFFNNTLFTAEIWRGTHEPSVRFQTSPVLWSDLNQKAFFFLLQPHNTLIHLHPLHVKCPHNIKKKHDTAPIIMKGLKGLNDDSNRQECVHWILSWQ